MRWSLLLLPVLVACAEPGPSDADVAYAVVKYVKENDGYAPLTGSYSGPCGVMKGPIIDARVEVIERGEGNEAENYFPVKVKVSGLCLAEFPNCGKSKQQLCPKERAEFTINEMVFRFTPGDFDTWTATRVDR